MNLIKNIFSISDNDNYKIIRVLGIKITFKKAKKVNIGCDFREEPNVQNELVYNPDALIIDMTTLCNNSCSFCWRSTKKNYLRDIITKYKKNHTMDFQVYKKIIDDATKYNSLRWLSLCGPMGEPLLNKNIVNFFKYAYQKNHFNEIVINTNGLAIDQHDTAGLLNFMHIFSVSVDSIITETYEKIHGSKDLAKVIQNIKNIIEYKNNHGGAEIRVRFTENELNKGQYDEFENFFFNLGVDSINRTFVTNFMGAYDQLLIDKTYPELCNQPTNVINFNFKGDITTCCHNWQLTPTFGNIKYHTLDELWHNEKMEQWAKTRLEDSTCRDCSGLGGPSQQTIIKYNPKLK